MHDGRASPVFRRYGPPPGRERLKSRLQHHTVGLRRHHGRASACDHPGACLPEGGAAGSSPSPQAMAPTEGSPRPRSTAALAPPSRLCTSPIRARHRQQSIKQTYPPRARSRRGAAIMHGTVDPSVGATGHSAGWDRRRLPQENNASASMQRRGVESTPYGARISPSGGRVPVAAQARSRSNAAPTCAGVKAQCPSAPTYAAAKRSAVPACCARAR
jgi:hypothetical protein